MTPEDICGNCGASIPKDSDSCPNCPPPRKKTDPVPIFLVVAVLCSSFLLLSSSVVNVATVPVPETAAVEPAAPSVAAPKDVTVAAYEAAQKFIQEKFPGPKRFSELYQSSVERNGNDFTVTLSADELSGTSPVRYFFSVEMNLSGETWSLKEIKR